MDGRGFDDLTRGLARGRSRRTVIKGVFGLGGAAAVAALSSERTGAAWSTLVCLPVGNESYTPRLVPTAAVPFYVARYGAISVGDSSPSCPPPLGLNDRCECACVAPRVEFPDDGTCALPCNGSQDCAVCGGTCAAALGEGVDVCYSDDTTNGNCERTDQCALQYACFEGTCRPLC